MKDSRIFVCFLCCVVFRRESLQVALEEEEGLRVRGEQLQENKLQERQGAAQLVGSLAIRKEQQQEEEEQVVVVLLLVVDSVAIILG